MTGLLMTQKDDTLRSRLAEDDLFSLEDMASKPSSATSLFSADYEFTDDEGKSFSNHASLYVDMENEKQATKKQQDAPSGALEALLSPTPRKRSLKLKTGKRSSDLDALLSPAASGKKKTTNRSATLDALLSPPPAQKKKAVKRAKNSKSAGSTAETLDNKSKKKKVSSQPSPGGSRKLPSIKRLEIDENEYETDTCDEDDYETDTCDEYETDTDDEDFQFLSESKAKPLSKKDLVDRALSMERTSMRRSLSKKKRDTLSLSNHSRKGRKDEVASQSPRSPRNRSLSNKRTVMMDALSLSSRTTTTEAVRRTRKGSKRENFLGGSASNLDYAPTPKRATSLRSLSIVRGAEQPPNHGKRSSSASKIKRKNFDRSGHSTSGDDDLSQVSAPVTPVRRKKKGSLDSCSTSSETSLFSVTSQPTPRRSLSTGTRRKKKEVLDQSGHSVASENIIRRSSPKSKPSDPQLDSLLSPGSTKERRKLKKFLDAEDELVQPGSFRSLPAGSDHHARRRSMKKAIKNGVASPSPKQKSRSSSLRVKGDDMADVVSKKMRNMSLSSSEHGGPKRSSKAGKVKAVRKMRRYSTAM
ncbi:unnamed protein product [Cylindrotheca closterium]|uniref:Uncharacterized protein n=1 Tax=Cylindrotheca closterium TaxID=2856 RepID=A0AAD2FMK7_9STRA|nr:unnamed protein product [Cylindrotheca closterium]